jgi:hypothetical protein
MGRVLPGLQAHLRLRSVCPLRDKLCRRFAGDGPVQLVLHSLEKRLRDLGIAVVVDAALLIDVGDLEIEAPLASPDGPDALQQVVKIILAKPLSLLQTLIVEYESFDQKLPEHLSRPDAKLRRLTAVDPVADGDDGVEIVELDFAGDLPRPFRLNYTKFSYSCHFIQFIRLINLLEVVIDGLYADAEQLSHLLLGEPE